MSIGNAAQNGTTSADNLDYGWVKALTDKRQAQASSVILVQSKDQRRLDQLEGVLSTYPQHQLYSYDPWNGLRKKASDGSQQWQTIGLDAGAYAPQEQLNAPPSLSDLHMALRYMDPLLKSQPSILLMKDLEGVMRNDHLQFALRAWSLDPMVLSHESVIVVQTRAPDAIADQATLDQLLMSNPPLPTASERAWLIQRVAHQLDLQQLEDCPRLTQATSGLDLQQLETLLLETHYRCPQQGFSLRIILQLKDEIISKSEMIEVVEPSWGFEAVGGYESVKRLIREKMVLPLNIIERAAQFGISLPRGLLLFGPPGTGKTLLAKALAKEMQLPFINLKTENLFDKHLGETGRRLSEVIRLVEQMSPAIVFIDEIDRLGQRGGGGDGASQETRRAFGQMLEWLGEPKRRAIIVGTTNSLEHLDSAFLRVGRFDYKVPFLWPNVHARKEILAIHLGVHPNATKTPPPFAVPAEEINLVLSEIAERTRHFSGAELEQLIMRTRRNAFNTHDRDHVQVEDFRAALQGMRIPLQSRQEELRHYMRQAHEHTDDVVFLEDLERDIHGEP